MDVDPIGDGVLRDFPVATTGECGGASLGKGLVILLDLNQSPRFIVSDSTDAAGGGDQRAIEPNLWPGCFLGNSEVRVCGQVRADFLD